MAKDEAVAVVQGIRQAIQDLLAPELREMRADMRAIRDRLDAMDKRFDRVDLLMERRFERLEHQLDTYGDVQTPQGADGGTPSQAATLSLIHLRH